MPRGIEREHSEPDPEKPNSYKVEQWSKDDLQAIHEKLEVPNWAPWLVDSPETMSERIEVFPEGQLLMRDTLGNLVGSISTNRVNWPDAPNFATLPESWDWFAGLAEGFSFKDANEPEGNALAILVINIDPTKQGERLPSQFVDLARELSNDLGADYIIGPFRPSGYGKHKLNGGLLSFTEYCNLRREDGHRQDAWLRNVERNGGVFFTECVDAMKVEIPNNELVEIAQSFRVGEWKENKDGSWESGETGIWKVDLESGKATYTESNLWGAFGVETEAPSFPEFRPLKITDKKWLEDKAQELEYTHCDHQFFGRWIWSGEEVQVSEVNGNVVFKHPEYTSFLGNNKIVETVEEIFEYQSSLGEERRIELLPENLVAHALPELMQRFSVEEQRDFFDYVYDLKELAGLVGTKYAKQRNKVNKFLKNFPEAESRELRISEESDIDQIIDLAKLWSHASEVSKDEFEEEFNALSRLIEFSNSHRVISTGIYLKDKLIGVAINGHGLRKNAFGYFRKADRRYSGVYQYLEKETAMQMLSLGYATFNNEYDLGNKSLRQTKSQWRPIELRKKFVISE